MLILLFSIFYFWLAWWRLNLSLGLLLALLPTYLIRFHIFGLPSTLLEAMILISFAVWLLKNYKIIFKNLKARLKRQPQKVKQKFIHYPFDIEIALLLVVSYAAVFVAGFSYRSLGLWRAYFFEPVLVFILVLNILADRYQQKKSDFDIVFYPLALSAFGLSCFAIWQKATGFFIVKHFWPRVTSIFPYPNALGLYLGPIILLLVGWLAFLLKDFSFSLAKPKYILRISFIGLTIILAVLSLFFAQSEGALAGTAVGLFVFVWLAGKRWRYLAVGSLIISLAAIIFFAPAKNYVVKKITLHDLSGEIRRLQWSETIKMLKSSPTRFVFGGGLAGYKQAVKPYHQEGFYFNKENDPDFRRKIVIFNDKYRAEHWQPVEIYLYPHNIFLNFWTELGLVGMILFVWIIGKYILISFRGWWQEINLNKNDFKYLFAGLVGAMTVIVVHGLVDVPYFKNDLACLFWLLVALTSWLDLRYKRERKKQVF